MTRVVKLALIPGDGIGPEVVGEAEKVLDAAVADPHVEGSLPLDARQKLDRDPMAFHGRPALSGLSFSDRSAASRKAGAQA